MCDLKTISYRGGIVRFTIPQSWKEEYEPEGGATFYEDAPDSGTLRLSVLSCHSKGAKTCQQMVSGLIADGGYETLQEGLAIKSHVDSAEEKGHWLEVHYWEVAVPVSPDRLRMAIFSFTILAAHADETDARHDIELLDRSIRGAEYSRSQGLPSACDELFQEELKKRGLVFSITPEWHYKIAIQGTDYTVNLENIRRNYERDDDAGIIIRFVDNVLRMPEPTPPTWMEVQPYLRFSLEPSNYVSGFDDVLFDRISDELYKVYVYARADGSWISWVYESCMKAWGVDRGEVVRQADSNMRDLVLQAKCEFQEIDGVKLGMLAMQETTFKASLILSSAFRDLVAGVIGWPVYVVVPCRDFAFVISATDRDFLGRLGRVVVDQYRKSGHPITKDVLEVSDDGIKAIGTYPDDHEKA
jgi:hypothetical protein